MPESEDFESDLLFDLLDSLELFDSALSFRSDELDELRDRFTDRYRRPASVIGIEPTEVYLHCAKCIRRGGLWDPRSWADPGEGPSAGAILASHAGLDDVAAVDAGLEQSYARGLAEDRPG